MIDVAFTHGDRTATARLRTTTRGVELQVDMQSGHGTLGPYSVGDPIVVVTDSGSARQARFAGGAGVRDGILSLRIVWADDLDGLDAERERARELVGLWAGGAADALRELVERDGATATARRLGVTRSAIYKRLNRE